MNALEGVDATGRRVKGWKVYNTVKAPASHTLVSGGITEMKRAVPLYEEEKAKKDKP
jgi:hypothetical protein